MMTVEARTRNEGGQVQKENLDSNILADEALRELKGDRHEPSQKSGEDLEPEVQQACYIDPTNLKV